MNRCKKSARDTNKMGSNDKRMEQNVVERWNKLGVITISLYYGRIGFTLKC